MQSASALLHLLDDLADHLVLSSRCRIRERGPTPVRTVAVLALNHGQRILAIALEFCAGLFESDRLIS